jgi:hypothetical protein
MTPGWNWNELDRRLELPTETVRTSEWFRRVGHLQMRGANW